MSVISKRPGIAAGPSDLNDLRTAELRNPCRPCRAAWRHAAAAGVLLRQFGNHGFGGDQQARNRRRVLDRCTKQHIHSDDDRAMPQWWLRLAAGIIGRGVKTMNLSNTRHLIGGDYVSDKTPNRAFPRGFPRRKLSHDSLRTTHS